MHKKYIVTTPGLVQAIQKQPKVLAFSPIEAKVAIQVCGSSKDAHKILMNNVNGDEGDWRIFHRSLRRHASCTLGWSRS
ncbi:hypothetical protein N7G274_009079 [Stereocaulon virgatum]|uniref:Uncharacterized protein n=1 Tax=Stereocaulon virgatum TaxID=373712 RepID=A0ABR4A1A9_9LECA